MSNLTIFVFRNSKNTLLLKFHCHILIENSQYVYLITLNHLLKQFKLID